MPSTTDWPPGTRSSVTSLTTAWRRRRRSVWFPVIQILLISRSTTWTPPRSLAPPTSCPQVPQPSLIQGWRVESPPIICYSLQILNINIKNQVKGGRNLLYVKFNAIQTCKSPTDPGLSSFPLCIPAAPRRLATLHLFLHSGPL